MQAPTQLLADRYRFKQSLDLGAKSVAWTAVDEQTQREVVASALPTARVAALMGVVGLRHPHLAGIVDVVNDPDPEAIPGGTRVRAAGIVVAELIRGPTLHQALKKGPLLAVAAARAWLGLCEAVRSMHQVGGAHGAISPRSVVISPSDGRPGPVLTQLLSPSSGAYCAPERLQGRGPSTADDVWALHASLFAAVTGSPPFKGDTKDQLVLSMASGKIQQLGDFGVRQPELQQLLEQGLTADLTRRRSEVAALIQGLHDWLGAIEMPSPGPMLHSPESRDWEEDAATVVQTEAEIAAASNRQGAFRPPPAPVFSMPPVPVMDDGSDEDDATTIMHQPPAEAIEAALRARFAASKLERDEDEDPYPSPQEMVVPRTFDDETQRDAMRQEMPSEPATAIMTRDMLPPNLPTFGSAPAPPAAAPPIAPKATESGFPPPLSAFPPPISRPPPAGVDLAQIALATDDIAVRKAGRGPLIVIFAILLVVGIAIAVAMFMNYRSAPVGRGDNDVAPAPTDPAARQTTRRAPETNETPSSASSANPSLAAAVSKATGATERPECVMAHFAPGSFKPAERFEFICENGDLRGITSQLHRRLVVAGVGKVTQGMKEWSMFGWFELGATALIRSSCCTAADAQAFELPKTPGKCAQLRDALITIARRPVKPEEVSARTEQLEDTVACLFSNGIPRPYSYRARPSDAQRKAFESFFMRTVERRKG